MTGRREQRAEEIRARILDAAYVCLEDGGFANERILTSIAREAGVSRPTLYRYFTDIEAVRDALIHQELTRAIEFVMPLVDRLEWSATGLADLLGEAIHYIRSHPLFAAAKRDIPLTIHRTVTSEAAATIGFVYLAVGPKLREQIADGRLPEFDVELSVDMISRVVISLTFTEGIVPIDTPRALRRYLMSSGAQIIDLAGLSVAET